MATNGNDRQFIMKSCFIFLVIVAAAAGTRDTYPDHVMFLWGDHVLHRFYGPWTSVRKANGDYADYNDYGAHIQDYSPSNEDIPADDPPVVEGPSGDFQSNYGETIVNDPNDQSQPGNDDSNTAEEAGDDQSQGDSLIGQETSDESESNSGSEDSSGTQTSAQSSGSDQQDGENGYVHWTSYSE